jgi:hypothetical protein
MERPDFLKKLVSAYEEYSKDVRIVVPQLGNAGSLSQTQEAEPA